MKLIEVNQVNDTLAEMVALFRVELRSYKGIVSKPNIEAGREEMEEYLSAKFPVFAALVDGEYAGYVVCRIDSKVVWVESIFVKEEYRRHGCRQKPDRLPRFLFPLLLRRQRESKQDPQDPDLVLKRVPGTHSVIGIGHENIAADKDQQMVHAASGQKH